MTNRTHASILDPIVNKYPLDPDFAFEDKGIGTAMQVAESWDGIFSGAISALEKRATEVQNHIDAGEKVLAGRAITRFRNETGYFRENRKTAETDLDTVLAKVEGAGEYVNPVQKDLSEMASKVEGLAKKVDLLTHMLKHDDTTSPAHLQPSSANN